MKKMQLDFDSKGYLFPYKKIKLSIEEFEGNFVTSFDSESTRSKIFKSYLKFLEDFRNEISPSFIQWIDGSFISKKLNPNDIDFVTLIKHDIYKKHRRSIDNKFRLKKAKEIYGVDELYPTKNQVAEYY